MSPQFRASAPRALQQAPELIGRQLRIPGNTAHREGVDGILPRDHQTRHTIGHGHVLGLPYDAIPELLEDADRLGCADARDLRHVRRRPLPR